MPRSQIHEFTVEGRTAFPIDMLRYDSCWPASPDAVSAMDSNLSREPGVVSVQLRSHHEPTIARWNSFGWSVKGASRWAA